MNHAKSVRYFSLFAAFLLLSASAFGATHKKKHGVFQQYSAQYPPAQ